MTYPIGTRVKVIYSNHPENLGKTGQVCLPADPIHELMVHSNYDGYDMCVRSDSQMVMSNSLGEHATMPAGTVGPARSKNWVPILLGGLEAADEDFKVPLPEREGADACSS